MSHSKEEEEAEDIQCLIDHTKILMETLTDLNKNPSKQDIITKLDEIKKRVEYMIADLKGEI